MRVLAADGRWQDVNVASQGQYDIIANGISGDGRGESIRLTDGPNGARRYVSYSRIAHTNPWIRACVDTIGRGLARLALCVKEEGEDGIEKEIYPGSASDAERFAKALRFPGQSKSRFLESTRRTGRKALWLGTAWDRFTYGNALWLTHRTGRDGIDGFERHPWRYTFLDEETMTYYPMKTDTAGRRQVDKSAKWGPQDVIHFGLWYDGDRPQNSSPIDALRATIALYDAVERHLLGFFNNGAYLSGVVKVSPNTMSNPTLKKAIADELLSQYSGPDNAGKVMLTSGDWTEISAQPDRSKVVELAEQSRVEICGTFSVPPPLVGILDNAIMSNVRELRDHYVRDLTGPNAELFEDAIAAQVIDFEPGLEDITATFDLDAQLRADPEARAKSFRDMLQVYSLNEMRKREGLPRVDHPAADIPWGALNMRPIDAKEFAAADGGVDYEKAAKLIQQTYLAVGVTMTDEECRKLVSLTGFKLEGAMPEEEPDPVVVDPNAPPADDIQPFPPPADEEVDPNAPPADDVEEEAPPVTKEEKPK